MTLNSFHSVLLTLLGSLKKAIPWKTVKGILLFTPILALLFIYPPRVVLAAPPVIIVGLYETLRSTPVYSRPSEDSQRVTTIESGVEVLVVNVRGDWLEVRSGHGRGSGFIRRENARFVKAQFTATKVLAKSPTKEAPVNIKVGSAETLVQLPTRESGVAQTPQLKIETAPGATVGAVSEDELNLLKGVVQGKGLPAKRRRSSAIQSPDFSSYLEMIKRRVESAWRNPGGISGRHQVILGFVLNRGGELVRVEVKVQDSTHSKLAQGVLEAVRRASPFPPIPESLKDLAGRPLRIKFEIDFGVKVAKRTGQATGRKGKEVHRETVKEPASDVADYVMLSKSGAKWVYSCSTYGRRLKGDVPPEIDLSSDVTAKKILNQAFNFPLKECLYRYPIEIYLYQSNKLVVSAKATGYTSHKAGIYRDYRNIAIKEAMLARGHLLRLAKKHYLFLLGTDVETGTKFWRYSRDPSLKCWKWAAVQSDVIGEVPKTVSLLNDTIPRSLVLKGEKMSRSTCKGDIITKVRLVPFGYHVRLKGRTYMSYHPLHVVGEVRRDYPSRRNPQITRYANHIFRAEQIRLQEKARAETWDKFVQKYGVHKITSKKEVMVNMHVNPFAYEGKTVAIYANLKRMVSPDTGVFGDIDFNIIASSIPRNLFTSRNTVVLVGRVLGLKEGMPHLNFVGAHFCKAPRCSDILPR